MPALTWISASYARKAGLLRKRFAANKPFPHLRLPDFFNSRMLERVRRALLRERFYEQEADLFSFEQTDDLKKSRNRVLREFRAFLRSKAFITWLRQVTGQRLSRTIDMSGFIYDDTDHLLPHDDKLAGRRIAYVINLSKGWSAKDGGQLDFFERSRIAKSYLPVWNSFVIFAVKPGTTFHQVREVVTDKKRLTLAGWFHG